MMLKVFYIELIGLVATLFVLLSACQSHKRNIRIVNSIGCVLFVIYGVLIHSLSVWLLNSACTCIQIYKLYKERSDDGDI